MSDEEDKALGEGKTCFVISPIGNKHAPMGTSPKVSYENSIQVWEKVLQPACEKFGLVPLRADKMSQPGEIPEQIFELLHDADIVIADVSGGNANVMYELGLRHTRDLLTVQIGEYEQLPFDVTTIRTIQFTRSDAGFIDLRNELIAALRAALRGEATGLTPTRVWSAATPLDQQALNTAAAASAEPDDSDDEIDEPGFVDVLAEGEAAVETINTTIEGVRANIEIIGNEAESAAALIEQSDEQGKGFAGRLRVATQLAESLREPTDVLENLTDDYRRDVDSLIAMLEYIIARLESGEEEEADQVREFLGSMIALADAAEESNVGIATMAVGARDMKKISRVLQDPGKRISRSLNRVIESSNRIVSLRQRLRDLLGDEGEGEAVAP